MPGEWSFDVWVQEYEDAIDKISARIKELKELAAFSSGSELRGLKARISSLEEARGQLKPQAKLLKNWGSENESRVFRSRSSAGQSSSKGSAPER